MLLNQRILKIHLIGLSLFVISFCVNIQKSTAEEVYISQDHFSYRTASNESFLGKNLTEKIADSNGMKEKSNEESELKGKMETKQHEKTRVLDTIITYKYDSLGRVKIIKKTRK